MIVMESTQVRRVIGRFERGESLLDGLRSVAAQKGIVSGSFRALGAFEWAELCEYEQEEKVYRPPIRVGHCEILNLTGNLSIRGEEIFPHVHAALSFETGAEDARGIRVVGGHLSAAQVFACEFVIDCYDDLVLRREYDAATGLDLWGRSTKELDVEGEPLEASSVGLSWSQVAAASEGTKKQAAPKKSAAPLPAAAASKPQLPKPGDEVVHKDFGRCRIAGRGTDGSLILKPDNGGRHRKVKLEYFEVLGPKKENGRRVFVLRARK